MPVAGWDYWNLTSGTTIDFGEIGDITTGLNFTAINMLALRRDASLTPICSHDGGLASIAREAYSKARVNNCLLNDLMKVCLLNQPGVWMDCVPTKPKGSMGWEASQGGMC